MKGESEMKKNMVPGIPEEKPKKSTLGLGMFLIVLVLGVIGAWGLIDASLASRNIVKATDQPPVLNRAGVLPNEFRQPDAKTIADLPSEWRNPPDVEAISDWTDAKNSQGMRYVKINGQLAIQSYNRYSNISGYTFIPPEIPEDESGEWRFADKVDDDRIREFVNSQSEYCITTKNGIRILKWRGWCTFPELDDQPDP